MTRPSRPRRREGGQVLILVALVLSLVGVTLIAGTGDIVMAQHEHERADEAATLGALSGAGTPSQASIYGGAPSLDTAAAAANCARAVEAVAPEAESDPNPCSIDASDPLRQRLLVTVVIHVSMPIPVPGLAPTVRAHREGDVVAGTQAAS